MECREALELLNEEADGRLAAADAARLAAHVASCSACAAEKRALASLRAAFRAVPKPSAPAGFREGVMSSLPRGRVRSLRLTVGWIAAAAAFLVVVVTLLPHDERSAEHETAQVRARKDAPAAAGEEAGPPPAPAAEPVAPPRPGPGFLGRLAEDRDEAAKSDSGNAKKAKAPGAGGGKAATPAKEGDREAAKPAAAPKSEDSAAAPAAKPPEKGAPPAKADERAKAADEAEDSLKVAAGAAPPQTVRYVVFSDGAAAAKFAELLDSDGAVASKDKNAAAPPAPVPAPGGPSGGAGGGAGGGGGGPAKPLTREPSDQPPAEARREDLVKEAKFRPRRVLARAPLPASLADADLAAKAAEAGGALVPAPDAAKFAELLDAPPAAPGDDKAAAPPASAAKPEDGEKDAGAAGLAPAAETKRKAAAAPVVVVVVVLDPAAGAKK
jgi:hypothetical protein